MRFDKYMIHVVYRCCLSKGWTAEELFEDVQNFCLERLGVGKTDKWADSFYNVLETYKQ